MYPVWNCFQLNSCVVLMIRVYLVNEVSTESMEGLVLQVMLVNLEKQVNEE